MKRDTEPLASGSGPVCRRARAFSEGSLPYGEMDQVLEFLYSREYGEEQEIRKDRGGSGDPSSLTVPSWIEKLRRLFPKSTAEIMERHALEKYNMTEL